MNCSPPVAMMVRRLPAMAWPGFISTGKPSRWKRPFLRPWHRSKLLACRCPKWSWTQIPRCLSEHNELQHRSLTLAARKAEKSSPHAACPDSRIKDVIPQANDSFRRLDGKVDDI